MNFPGKQRSDESLKVMHVFGGRIRSGTEAVVLNLSEQLRRNGGKAILVPLRDGAFSEEARDLGLEVCPLNKRGHLDLWAILRLTRMIREYQPDIVHSHAVNGAFYAYPAARLAGSVTHVSHHHISTEQSLADVCSWKPPRTLADSYHRWLLARCHRIITTNGQLKNELVGHKIPADKIFCIPNGIDFSRYSPDAQAREAVRKELHLAPNATIIGTACRLSPFKNLPMLLAVAHEMLLQGMAVDVVIVGEGPERERLVGIAEQMGIQHHVHLTGWRNDVPRVMAAMDIFVITSDVEGAPVVVLEAMALGMPLVSTNVGNLTDLGLLRDAGLLVPVGDVRGMADAMIPLVRDKGFARRIGQELQSVAHQQFSVERMFERTQQVYAEAVAVNNGL